MASAGSLYWFPSHSMSLEILHGFSSCPPKRSILIPTRKGLPGYGTENSHHFTISLYTWLLFCKSHRLTAALWFQTLFHWPRRTSAGIRAWVLEEVFPAGNLKDGLKSEWNDDELSGGTRGRHDVTAITAALRSESVADAADCSPHWIHLHTSDYVNSGELSLPKWCIHLCLCCIWNDCNTASIDRV